MKRALAPRLMGRHIVTNPKICHGKPTFRGTRVLVSDVLEQVASGVARETILAAQIRRKTPARRCGRPDELVGTAIFLASAASDFVTGVCIPVDGGYSAAGPFEPEQE